VAARPRPSASLGKRGGEDSGGGGGLWDHGGAMSLVLLAGLGFVLQTVGVVVVSSCFVAKANHHHDGKSRRLAHAGRKRREHQR
jgi:hypothetical protein